MEKVNNKIEIYITEESRYLQVNNITEGHMAGFIKYAAENFSGYTVDFCFKNGAIVPRDALSIIGAGILDGDADEMWLFDRGATFKADNVIGINEKNFGEFAKCYDKKYPGMYWNSERISQQMSDWAIFASYNKEELAGYITMWKSGRAEIYCLEAQNPEEAQALLSSAIAATDLDILFMIGQADEQTRLAAESLGFVKKGEYCSFRIILA